MKYTPDIISSLEENEIFVFGSTLGGAHRGGAAKLAVDRFGAIMGQGKGLQGRSYAIPSMLKSVNSIKPNVDEFLRFAEANPHLTFLVTKIGCGRAGFKEEEIAPLFAAAVTMKNICLPESFAHILGIKDNVIEDTSDLITSTRTQVETAKNENITDGEIKETTSVQLGDDNGFVETVVPQLSGPKIVGTVDLSKLPARSKCYIIDTNIFIYCPDIISKIAKRDKIVISAKVVDELDRKKVDLDEEGKKNAARALQLINRAIDSRRVQTALSDMSILPPDFGKSPDNMILSVALKFKEQNPVLLTSDNGFQIKAKSVGIKTMALKDFLPKI